MAKTDILPFASGDGANVITQEEYEAAAALLANGFQAGIAKSAQINKVMRQASFMAAGVAAWMVSRNIDVLDDGDLPALVGKIQDAIEGATSGSGSGGFSSGGIPATRKISTTAPLTGGVISAPTAPLESRMGRSPKRAPCNWRTPPTAPAPPRRRCQPP